jgi:hypothetical protein
VPFPRTWSEELVAEWLRLEGYLVETGVPIGSSEKGGRREADIIGYRRVREGEAEIYYIEVGSLVGSREKSVEMIQEKFSPENKSAVKSHLREIDPSIDQLEVKTLYVATYCTRPVYEFAKDKLPLRRLEDLIDEILDTIRKWKAKSGLTKTKGKALIPPDGMWLLDKLKHGRFGVATSKTT